MTLTPKSGNVTLTAAGDTQGAGSKAGLGSGAIFDLARVDLAAFGRMNRSIVSCSDLYALGVTFYAAHWSWDLARIRAKRHADNVVDLMESPRPPFRDKSATTLRPRAADFWSSPTSGHPEVYLACLDCAIERTRARMFPQAKRTASVVCATYRGTPKPLSPTLSAANSSGQFSFPPVSVTNILADRRGGIGADRSQNFIDGLIGPCMKFFSCFILQRMRNVDRRGVETDRGLLRFKGLEKLGRQTLTPVTPFLSRSLRSWVEHDVHDPQSDSAIMTAWHFSEISLIISRGATRVFVGFL